MIRPCKYTKNKYIPCSSSSSSIYLSERNYLPDQLYFSDGDLRNFKKPYPVAPKSSACSGRKSWIETKKSLSKKIDKNYPKPSSASKDTLQTRSSTGTNKSSLRIHGSIPDMRRKLHDQLFYTSARWAE